MKECRKPIYHGEIKSNKICWFDPSNDGTLRAGIHSKHFLLFPGDTFHVHHFGGKQKYIILKTFFPLTLKNGYYDYQEFSVKKVEEEDHMDKSSTQFNVFSDEPKTLPTVLQMPVGSVFRVFEKNGHQVTKNIFIKTEGNNIMQLCVDTKSYCAVKDVFEPAKYISSNAACLYAEEAKRVDIYF